MLAAGALVVEGSDAMRAPTAAEAAALAYLALGGGVVIGLGTGPRSTRINTHQPV